MECVSNHRWMNRPNYNDARPLLVIFHDPPELKGFPNPRTNKIELHNTWLVSAIATQILYFMF